MRSPSTSTSPQVRSPTVLVERHDGSGAQQEFGHYSPVHKDLVVGDGDRRVRVPPEDDGCALLARLPPQVGTSRRGGRSHRRRPGCDSRPRYARRPRPVTWLREGSLLLRMRTFRAARSRSPSRPPLVRAPTVLPQGVRPDAIAEPVASNVLDLAVQEIAAAEEFGGEA